MYGNQGKHISNYEKSFFPEFVGKIWWKPRNLRAAAPPSQIGTSLTGARLMWPVQDLTLREVWQLIKQGLGKPMYTAYYACMHACVRACMYGWMGGRLRGVSINGNKWGIPKMDGLWREIL